MSQSSRPWSQQFALRVVLWLLPVALVWMLLAPFYNRFLTQSGETLTRLTERPPVTRLQGHQRHHLLVTRTDVATLKGLPYSVRVTDVHFPLILIGAFFLAVPGVPWSKRLENLGWAVLIAVFFHIVSLVFWVKFIYTTQLGAFSLESYGPWQRNFWGLGKHLIDLPGKFALPLVLWAAFYLRLLLPGRKM